MENEIVNKVASSSLVQIDLEELYHPAPRILYDLKQNLFMELILKEKDFRDFIKEHDWSQYKGANVALTCTADAIVPTWAFMLLATKLAPVVNKLVFGSLEDLETALYTEAIDKLNFDDYKAAKVVVKGCSNKPVPVSAYTHLTAKLTPIVSSLMFGEPCSTVPLLKNKLV